MFDTPPIPDGVQERRNRATACSACAARSRCLPWRQAGAAGGGLQPAQRAMLRGEHLQQAGDSVRHTVYMVQSGQLKTYRLSADGRQSVERFARTGDVLGLGTLNRSQHRDNTMALTDCVLCEFSYPALLTASLRQSAMAAWLNERLMNEIAQAQSANLLLCHPGAVQRLASFLVQAAAERDAETGCGDALELVMTRNDIGDYLGLAAETVSRTLNRLQARGYLRIQKNQLQICDHAALQAVAAGRPALPA